MGKKREHYFLDHQICMGGEWIPNQYSEYKRWITSPVFGVTESSRTSLEWRTVAPQIVCIASATGTLLATGERVLLATHEAGNA